MDVFIKLITTNSIAIVSDENNRTNRIRSGFTKREKQKEKKTPFSQSCPSTNPY